MDINIILIILSALIVVSYLYNILFDKAKIPSVLLLIATGIALKYFAEISGFVFVVPFDLINIIGTIGLIMIVLEGALDLDVTKQKLPLMGKSFLSALFILLATSGMVYLILFEFVHIPFRNAVIYSIPFGVISSAIAIPSVKNLSERKKEFIVYESTFSDIFGIMVFNYVILENAMSSDSVIELFESIFLIIAISFISSALLVFLLNNIQAHVKSFLVFALLVLVYSVGKIFHLPSLLLILIFGMMLNNNRHFIKGKLAEHLHLEKMAAVTAELKLLTAESAFLVRTFFFVLFGFMMDIKMLLDVDTVLVGSVIICGILFLRFIFLRFISRTHVIPELFIAPRGLITVVLFYAIPPKYYSELFNEGILYFVIIVSSIIMMFGLIFTKTEFIEEKSIVIGEDEKT